MISKEEKTAASLKQKPEELVNNNLSFAYFRKMYHIVFYKVKANEQQNLQAIIP